MIKVENIEVWGFEHAVRDMFKDVGVRFRKGRYETAVSIGSRTVSCGTYSNEKDAHDAVTKKLYETFVSNVLSYGVDTLNDLVPVYGNYFASKNGNIYNKRGKLMVGAVDRCGYRNVIINGRSISVHRIIAETFIPNPNNFPQVNHKDGNKLNNMVQNLEWCTRSYNLLHVYENGLEVPAYGEQNVLHKLTEEDVRYIRRNAVKNSKEFGFAALGRKFNVDKSVIADIYYHKAWRHVV